MLLNALTATIGPYLGIGVMFCLLAVWKEETASRTDDFFGRTSYQSHAYRRHLGDLGRWKAFRLFRHDRGGARSQSGRGAARVMFKILVPMIQKRARILVAADET
jgi:hypothetical protein